MHGPEPIAPWPQPSSTRSREPSSSRLTARAPCSGVAGSKVLPTTRTGADVVTAKGPVKRSSWVTAGQPAHVLDAQVHRAPNHGDDRSARLAASTHVRSRAGLSESA